jgi:hypothetical protein
MASQELIEKAIASHGAWRTRLGQAIVSGTADVDLARVKRDDLCELGKWLYREADSIDRRSATYVRVRQLHAAFHLETARVLELAIQGRQADAEAAMALRTPFASTSAALTAALAAWRDGVGVLA